MYESLVKNGEASWCEGRVLMHHQLSCLIHFGVRGSLGALPPRNNHQMTRIACCNLPFLHFCLSISLTQASGC